MKITNTFTFSPGNPSSGCLSYNYSCIQIKNVCKIFALSGQAKRSGKLKCLSGRDWRNNLGYIHKMQYYSMLNKNTMFPCCGKLRHSVNWGKKGSCGLAFLDTTFCPAKGEQKNYTFVCMVLHKDTLKDSKELDQSDCLLRLSRGDGNKVEVKVTFLVST